MICVKKNKHNNKAVRIVAETNLQFEINKTPAKPRDIFALSKKSGGGEIRTHNLLIDSTEIVK